MTSSGGRPAAGAAVLRTDITEALQDALLEELATVGYGRLSIEGVARRAGVAKTAVYRRWRSKLEMVLEMVSAVVSRRLAPVDTGSLAGDLQSTFDLVTLALRHPLAQQILPDLLAETSRNAELGAVLRGAIRQTQSDLVRPILNRAVARGELPEPVDPETAAAVIAGPVYWHLAVAGTPLPPDAPRRLASMAMSALTTMAIH